MNAMLSKIMSPSPLWGEGWGEGTLLRSCCFRAHLGVGSAQALIPHPPLRGTFSPEGERDVEEEHFS
jgi:hypothetical protein